MKIETFLQPNCSDLVSHLGLNTDEKLVTGLKKITNAGLQICFCIHNFGGLDSLYIPLAEEHLEKVTLDFLNEDTITNILKVTLVQPLLKSHGFDLNSLNDDAYVTVQIVDKSKTKRIKYKSYSRPSVTIKSGDGYDETSEAVIKTGQHCTEYDFPIFTKVRKLFEKGWHVHDGGSPNEYEEWLGKNNLEDDRDRRLR